MPHDNINYKYVNPKSIYHIGMVDFYNDIYFCESIT